MWGMRLECVGNANKCVWRANEVRYTPRLILAPNFIAGLSMPNKALRPSPRFGEEGLGVRGGELHSGSLGDWIVAENSCHSHS